MSVRTKTHPTHVSRQTRHRLKSRKVPGRGKAIPWRRVAKKEIEQYSEPGVMLRGCRYKKGVTQKDLADALSISQHHISEMENGKRSIGKEMAKRLASYFNTDYRIFL